ncbi:MAG: CHAP domain-containing protein, partial [Clostridia bacterium]|nr:CHAP domain-containing protein [Clostridia bacterium]
NNNVVFNTHFYGMSVSGSAYPWCCAFVWDIFRMCGASQLFNGGQKTAYCPTVLNWGRNNGLTVSKANGQYGDIVLFDWNGDGIADHIGLIIAKNADGSYTTVEGNTANSNYSNGGYVLRMTRYQYQIIGIVRPKYDGTTSTTPTTTSTPSKPDILYQVYTSESGWLPVVKNLEDYAGEDGQAIKGIRVFINGDTVAVQIHQMSNGNIDKLTIFAGKHTVRYRVRTIGSKNYLDYMENKKDTGGSSDTYAGESGKAIDRVQIVVK